MGKIETICKTPNMDNFWIPFTEPFMCMSLHTCNLFYVNIWGEEFKFPCFKENDKILKFS